MPRLTNKRENKKKNEKKRKINKKKKKPSKLGRKFPIEIVDHIFNYIPEEASSINRAFRRKYSSDLDNRLFVTALKRGLYLFILDVQNIINLLPQKYKTLIERNCVPMYDYYGDIREEYLYCAMKTLYDDFKNKTEFVEFIVPYISEHDKDAYIKFVRDSISPSV